LLKHKFVKIRNLLLHLGYVRVGPLNSLGWRNVEILIFKIDAFFRNGIQLKSKRIVLRLGFRRWFLQNLVNGKITFTFSVDHGVEVSEERRILFWGVELFLVQVDIAQDGLVIL